MNDGIVWPQSIGILRELLYLSYGLEISYHYALSLRHRSFSICGACNIAGMKDDLVTPLCQALSHSLANAVARACNENTDHFYLDMLAFKMPVFSLISVALSCIG
jgi:hypothetical protein